MLRPFSASRVNLYTYQGHAFFRSYGVNLPSSLTGVLSSALAFSAHLPVSVCGTGARSARYEDFLGSMGSANPLGPKTQGPITSQSNEIPDLPRTSSYRLGLTLPIVSRPALLRSPFARTLTERYRNINLFSIAYAIWPRLRSRLTLSGLAFPRKP